MSNQELYKQLGTTAPEVMRWIERGLLSDRRKRPFLGSGVGHEWTDADIKVMKILIALRPHQGAKFPNARVQQAAVHAAERGAPYLVVQHFKPKRMRPIFYIEQIPQLIPGVLTSIFCLDAIVNAA